MRSSEKLLYYEKPYAGKLHVRFCEGCISVMNISTRYCIIVVKSEKVANRVMESITKFIEKKLGLKVNIEKSKIAKLNQIKYLGFGFYYTTTGKIKPKPYLKSIQKFKRKLNQVIRGWVNCFRIADMKGYMEDITSHLNRRIRCIIWKQWKVPRYRTKCLMKLGLDKDTAKSCSYSRKSYWCTSMCIHFIRLYLIKDYDKKDYCFQ